MVLINLGEKISHPRGSGNDRNSDTYLLQNESNRHDKTVEDSFPASDPPSNTPMSGVGRTNLEVPTGQNPEFTEIGASQFEYGRRAKTADTER